MNIDYIIKDYITGKAVRNAGPEASRQIFEKFLVQDKGYAKKVPIEFFNNLLDKKYLLSYVIIRFVM